MKLRIGCLLAGFLLFVLSAAAQTASSGATSSQVPPLIQFSSVASDEGGNSMSGMVNLTFSGEPAMETLNFCTRAEFLRSSFQTNYPIMRAILACFVGDITRLLCTGDCVVSAVGIEPTTY